MKKNILDLTHNDNNKIVEQILCKYTKTNILNEDNIYLIITKNMKKNLENNPAIYLLIIPNE